jgi:hypothetical protein
MSKETTTAAVPATSARNRTSTKAVQSPQSPETNGNATPAIAPASLEAHPPKPGPVVHLTGGRTSRIDPLEEYRKVTGFDRADMIRRIADPREYVSQEQKRLHEKGEAAYDIAMKKTPKYFMRRFHSHAKSSYREESAVCEAAERLLRSLAPSVLDAAHNNDLIPSVYGTVDEDELMSELSRKCSGPVAIQQDQLPGLFRFLRVALVWVESARYKEEMAPFAWEAMGDDNAADWDNPATARTFAALFARTLQSWDTLACEWAASGLCIDDLIEYDLADESGAFTLTIVQPEHAANPELLDDDE